ncbi:hypothetical protein ACFQH3_20105 [Haladaptatus sp. GCM10025707]|uniref:hypothetical protein n=1 Tax=unclassified Haladaptatus TaxID=2622732 RepID=UPI0023E7E872|nr:hypothetical protein [Haladaptatus sp. QDMS2]
MKTVTKTEVNKGRNMRLLSLLCLGVLVVLAGCSLGPTGQEGPVTVVVNNSANTSHTFEVWVVEGELINKEVRIRKKDGTVDRASPGPGLSTYKLDDDYGFVTSIELPSNRSRLHNRYTLDPGNLNRSSIEKFETGSTVVVVIYDGDRVRELVAAHCDGDLVFVEVIMFEYGSGSAYNCEGGLF